MCRLKLLGGTWVQRESSYDDESVTQHPHLGLLSLLSQSPHQRSPREKLIAYLWPDHASKDARHLLNTSVYAIRQSLSKEVILTRADDLQLNTDLVSVDVNAFRSALRANDPAAAVALYDGPFMDGFFLNGSHAFQRWVEWKRQELSFAYAGALECLATEAMERGDYEAAVQWWHRLSIHDPYNSRVAVGLMRAMRNSGNRAGAVLHARRHATLLREDLGLEPDPSIATFAKTLAMQSNESS